MANNIRKNSSRKNYGQVLQNAYNDIDATITTNGFLVGKVGCKVTLAISTTTVADDTETYTFFDNELQLYQIRLIYTSAAKTQLISAERIS